MNTQKGIHKGIHKGINYEIRNSEISTFYCLKEKLPIFGGETFIGSHCRYKDENSNIKNYTKQHVKKVIDRYISLYTPTDIKKTPIVHAFDELVIYRGFCAYITHKFEGKNLDMYTVDEIAPISGKMTAINWYDLIEGHTFTENFVKIMIDFQLKLKGKQDYKSEEIEQHDWEEAKPLLDIFKQRGTDIQCVLKS